MPQEPCRAGGGLHRLHQDLRRPDPPPHPQGPGVSRARHRRLRPFRHAREIAPILRGRPPLGRGGRAEGASGPGRHPRVGGGGGDQEIRHRSEQAQSGNGVKGTSMSSITEIKVPDIGDFKEVEVIEILVKPGDSVAKEASLITVESDKATMEIPSPAAGVVKEVRVKLGDKVAEGSMILLLEASEGEAPATQPPKSAEISAPPAPAPKPAAARE